MPSTEIAGVTVEVDADGHMTDRGQWTREVGEAIATDLGITMTDAHWKVIEFLQSDYAEKGQVPSIRRIKNAGGIPTKELYALYPDGPLKKASKIAGLPKPASCV
jgi:tRNA 2-thiouridine synthesizing protein E